jgi:NADH-quinone oxidoreductase subunit F
LFREKTYDGSYAGSYGGNYGGSSGGSILKKKDILFYKKQTRSILNYCGKIDAESIKEYFAVGGYSAFEKALFDIQSEDICKEIWYSKLRGRGGAGFPVGYKWMNVLKEEASPKYVLCNGNEGSPGAFADMALMEGVPHQIIEGMLIAAKAVGAMQGYIYIRENYHCAFDRLSIAVKQAEDYCLLGNNMLGTGFNFNITLCRGADYFICGESSALIASLSPEGKRAVPSAKRYHISQRGIYEKPTLLNNAETFANVPLIINNSADWYRETGYENSTGTKLLTLTGDVVNCGLIEVNMGANLLDVIYDIGGGISNNRDIKAVQVGGPLSPFLAFEDLDIPIDFDSLTSVGASMGSGSIVVTDISHCIVELSRFFMHFMQKESCGKCTPCREGTLHIFKILKRITEGKGKEGDIEIIEEIADTVINTSLCGFGKSASNVLMSALKYFRDEFDDHVYNHKCVTGVCKIQDA